MSQRPVALTRLQQETQPLTQSNQPKHPRSSFNSNRIKSILHSLAWVAAASLTAVWTDLPNILLHNKQVSTSMLTASAACLIGVALVVLYLAVILPRTHELGVTVADDYYANSPHSIHAILTLSSIAYVCGCVAIWPVMGWRTPPVLSMCCMGGLMAINLLPSCGGRDITVNRPKDR